MNARDPSGWIKSIPFPFRLGNCYELAAQFIIWHRDAILVHGRITNPRPSDATYPRVDHAWVEVGSTIYDPVTAEDWPAPAYENYFQAEIFQKYDAIEVGWLMNFTRHYGPWHENPQ